MLKIERINKDHQDRFITAVGRSIDLHRPWVSPPSDKAAFDLHLKKYTGTDNISYVAVNHDAELVACINLNEIVRGAFQSAYLGYYVFVPFNAKGLMAEAMQLVMSCAFDELGLHRLEANIQPKNINSLQLVKTLGFRREGFSPRYLKVHNAWCDHERYAITAEEFNQL